MGTPVGTSLIDAHAGGLGVYHFIHWRLSRIHFLLPPAYVVRREVMFSQVCVCSGGGIPYPLVPGFFTGGFTLASGPRFFPGGKGYHPPLGKDQDRVPPPPPPGKDQDRVFPTPDSTRHRQDTLRAAHLLQLCGRTFLFRCTYDSRLFGLLHCLSMFTEDNNGAFLSSEFALFLGTLTLLFLFNI